MHGKKKRGRKQIKGQCALICDVPLFGFVEKPMADGFVLGGKPCRNICARDNLLHWLVCERPYGRNRLKRGDLYKHRKAASDVRKG